MLSYYLDYLFAIGGFAKAKEGVLATIKNKSLNVKY